MLEVNICTFVVLVELSDFDAEVVIVHVGKGD